MTSVEFETRSMDGAGDEIVTPHTKRSAALAAARLIRDELGQKAHVWQRQDSGEWVHVWPKRRWWLLWLR